MTTALPTLPKLKRNPHWARLPLFNRENWPRVDGICSAHEMVAPAKPKVVLPEFLPFLMMSDKFMNGAVDISVGSLSPTNRTADREDRSAGMQRRGKAAHRCLPALPGRHR